MTGVLAARCTIALGMVAGWATLTRLLYVEGTPHPRGLSALIDLSVLTTPAGFGAMTAVFLLAVVGFTLRRTERVTLVVIPVLLALGGHLLLAQWPGQTGANRSLTLPGAVAIAWLLADLWATRRGTSSEETEQASVDAACGVTAALYAMAAASKVGSSGLAWASGGNLALHISVHAYSGLEVLRPLRLAIADQPALCTVFGVGTLLIEGGFVLFVYPRLRPVLAILALLLHLSIGLVMGLHHYDWLFVVLGLGFYPRLTAPRGDSAPALG